MCEYPLCMQLREALSAAFHGKPLHTETHVGAWAEGFMKALQQLPTEASYPRGFIWHVANGILLSIYSKCPCEGLIDHISCRPEAFLRSVLLMGKMQDSRPGGDFAASARLH